jgi:hypothetical protein
MVVEAVNPAGLKPLWKSRFLRFPSWLWEIVGICFLNFHKLPSDSVKGVSFHQPLSQNTGHIHSLWQTVLFSENVTGGPTKDVSNWLLYDEQK